MWRIIVTVLFNIKSFLIHLEEVCRNGVYKLYWGGFITLECFQRSHIFHFQPKIECLSRSIFLGTNMLSSTQFKMNFVIKIYAHKIWKFITRSLYLAVKMFSQLFNSSLIELAFDPLHVSHFTNMLLSLIFFTF